MNPQPYARLLRQCELGWLHRKTPPHRDFVRSGDQVDFRASEFGRWFCSRALTANRIFQQGAISGKGTASGLSVAGFVLAKLLANENTPARTMMTVSSVGLITTLAFMSAIDAPARFTQSRSVGAYLGLTA